MSQKRRPVQYLTLVLAILFVITAVACGGSSAGSTQTGTQVATQTDTQTGTQSSSNVTNQEEQRQDVAAAVTGAATPAVDRDTLKVALSKNPSSLDPNEGNIQTFLITNCIFEHLCITDENGQTVPYLATEWKQTDELTWRFQLRDDVTFADGSPFNAESVAYTVNYLGTKEPKFKYATKWGNVVPIKDLQNYTVCA